MKILGIDVQIREPPLYSEYGIRYSKPGEILGRNFFVIDDITTHGETFLTCG
jgi:orotate phosphoribosyltransferase-like protein